MQTRAASARPWAIVAEELVRQEASAVLIAWFVGRQTLS